MLVAKLEKNESLMVMDAVSVDSLQRKEFCKDFEIKKTGAIRSFYQILKTIYLGSKENFQCQVPRFTYFQFGPIFR